MWPDWFLRDDWLHKAFLILVLTLICLADVASLAQRKLGRPIRRPVLRGSMAERAGDSPAADSADPRPLGVVNHE